MHDAMGTVDTGKTRCETVGIPKAVLDLKYWAGGCVLPFHVTLSESVGEFLTLCLDTTVINMYFLNT
jgi:hypothetical protein